MSIAGFYQDKAEECARMAAATTDPAKRSGLHEEAKLWREIARDIIRQDKVDEGPR